MLCHFLQPCCSGVPPWRRAEGWSCPLRNYIKVPLDAHDLWSSMEWVNAVCSCVGSITIPCTARPLSTPSDALTGPHQGVGDANKGCSGFPCLCWVWSGVRIVSLGAADLRRTLVYAYTCSVYILHVCSQPIVLTSTLVQKWCQVLLQRSLAKVGNKEKFGCSSAGCSNIYFWVILFLSPVKWA